MFHILKSRFPLEISSGWSWKSKISTPMIDLRNECPVCRPIPDASHSCFPKLRFTPDERICSMTGKCLSLLSRTWTCLVYPEFISDVRNPEILKPLIFDSGSESD